MTRRTRRRLFVFGGAAAIAASVPLWAADVLSALPAFRVQRIEVVGTRYVAPDEIVRLAGVDTAASVWDDPAPWEARVRAHELVREATVSRRGLRSLEIRVLEERPVALAATPRLVAVAADGRVLPLEPAEADLDLPLLRGRAGVVEDGRLEDPAHRRLAALLERLEEYDPAFVRQVSEVGLLPGGDVDVVMLEGAHCRRILLPGTDPLLGLRRVELALGAAAVPVGAPSPVAAADARFAGQVVLRRTEDR